MNDIDWEDFWISPDFIMNTDDEEEIEPEKEEHKKVSIEDKKQYPRNNDGRNHCWCCGWPTKRVPITPGTVFDICTNPQCNR